MKRTSAIIGVSGFGLACCCLLMYLRPQAPAH
jgi:hypothetical protein